MLVPPFAGPLLLAGPYGVITVRAADEAELFRGFGAAVARQRPEQLDRSRRAARGRLSERFGPAFVVADEATLRSAPSDAELRAQLAALPSRVRRAYGAYAEGVNAELPKEMPRWEVLDSVAITVRLMRLFGRGGSGELRNLALLSYLRGRPASREKALDLFDDLAPFEDSEAPTTLAAEDEAGFRPIAFAPPSRAQTEAQLARLPTLSLLESLGAARVASLTSEGARRVAAPFTTGSYAVAVASSRSTTGRPMLLSGPQMGFTDPSVAHEIRLESPTLTASGMDVPGIPAVLVGATPKIAWGLTTGVADTEDIVALESARYAATGERRTLRVQGEAPRVVTAERVAGLEALFRTADGKRVFVRKRAYEGKELASVSALFALYNADRLSECDRALRLATMNFNVLFAAPDGIGWRYTGLVPWRSGRYDPRLPVPDDVSAGWRGNIPLERMPHVLAPRSGLLTNWNTKPMRGWPNWDTPVWGRADHVRILREALGARAISPEALAAVPEFIAARPNAYASFRPYLPAAFVWDGRLTGGAVEPERYAATLDGLRRRLFFPILGDFGSPDLFRTVTQESLILRALAGETKVDYLAGGDPRALAAASLPAEASPFAPSSIRYGELRLTYLNRGTFLQLVRLGPGGGQWTALPPGVAESGPNARDQVALAQGFGLKPLSRPGGK